MDSIQHVFSHQPLSGIGNFLPDLVEQIPYSSHVRDGHTRKHLLANYRMVNACGFESIDDLIGVTSRELWIEDVTHRRENLNLDAVVISNEKKQVERAETLEDQVRLSKRPGNINRAILLHSGFVQFENVIKLPVLDANHKNIISFLTITRDLTFSVGLSKLFQLYQEHYPEQRAIQLFCKHLKINDYFTELPTLKEMQILCAMRHDPRHKRVAQSIHLTPGTAECYIHKLRDKLTVDLYNLLAQLRAIPVDEQDKDCL